MGVVVVGGWREGEWEQIKRSKSKVKQKTHTKNVYILNHFIQQTFLWFTI